MRRGKNEPWSNPRTGLPKSWQHVQPRQHSSWPTPSPALLVLTSKWMPLSSKRTRSYSVPSTPADVNFPPCPQPCQDLTAICCTSTLTAAQKSWVCYGVRCT
ncbi:hypothetical protein BDQ12DRAFT_682985 [Crucibulum laeve]|uniref:Uncharacterized protein n=1 Tax=Crucibulum laeve TaxID=68775 RepID=A0A5C3MD37_9AGAR|nr:hypothetical protein BDQ12DRAFT_682985 [Crucibulum laeve]